MKKTKEQKRFIDAIERQRIFDEAMATYPQRLMELLARAELVNFELSVYNSSTFRLRNRDAERDDPLFYVDLEYSEQADQKLVTLEWEVAFKESAEVERQRKLMVKQTALAKLTTEERNELGV
jgi:hypothetical protein